MEDSSAGSSSDSCLRRRHGVTQRKGSKTGVAAEEQEKMMSRRWVRFLGPCPLKKFSGRYSKSWRSFQQRRLRTSVQSVQMFLRVVTCVMLTSAIIRMISSEDFFFSLGNLAVVTMSSLALVVFYVTLKSVTPNSKEEWYLCVAHQAVFIVSAYIFSTMSLAAVDGVVQHRSFLMRFMCALACMVHSFYIPQPWHTVFVSLPAILTWIYFHFSVGFTKPVAMFWCIILPGVELLGFHFAELREWSLFRLMEHERHARQAGENLKEAMRGMLNVVFDASCECDPAGRLITTSQHLQNLLGAMPSELLDLELPKLAATPEESQRIINFLAQSAPREEGLVVSPPALMETTLRRQGQSLEESSSVFKVKLCCVALPMQYASDDDFDVRDNAQRVFVGLQEVQPPVVQRDVRETSSDQDAEAQVAQRDTRETSSEQDVPLRCLVPLAKPWQKREHLTKKLLIDAGTQQGSSYERREMDTRSLDSLTISLTGTHVTGDHVSVGPSVRASVASQTTSATQTSISYDISSVSTVSRACQTTPVSGSGSSGCPAIPGTTARSDASHLRHKRSKRKTFMSKTPFFARWKGTPAVTLEFLIVEQILVRINPFNQGCCFWHASLEFLASVIHDMLSRKCNPKFEPHAGWQCNSCKGLNERAEVDSEDEDETEACVVCECERGASLSGNEAAQSGSCRGDEDSDNSSISRGSWHSGRKSKEKDSDLGTESETLQREVNSPRSSGVRSVSY